jgi:hypothetical protein
VVGGYWLSSWPRVLEDGIGYEECFYFESLVLSCDIGTPPMSEINLRVREGLLAIGILHATNTEAPVAGDPLR